MSADDAYAILETIATLSGTADRLHKMTPEGHEIIDEKLAEEIESKTVYSEEAFLEKADMQPYAPPRTLTLFHR